MTTSEQLLKIVQQFIAVGQERNYRSDMYWDTVYALTNLHGSILRLEYPHE